MLSISYIDKVSIKVILFTALSIFAVPYYFYAGGTILGFIILRLLASVINAFGVIGSHRWLCHNSFKASWIGSKLMLLGMVLSGYGKPLHIVVAHRLHHVNSDTVNDPHSPKYMSFWTLWLGRYQINSNIIVPKDFFRNKQALFVNKYYWTLFILFNAIFMLIDLKSALIFCPLTFVYSWTLNTIINYNGHKLNDTIGPRNLNSILAVLTVGEALHKNHHDYPSRYNLSSPGHYDIGAWIIDKLLMDKKLNQRVV